MSHVLFLKPTSATNFTLQLSFGATKKEVPNLRSMEQLRNVIKREVSELILRYITHRQNALNHYGQLTPSRAQSISRIKMRFANYQTWHAYNLKPKILGIQEDLQNILPCQNSRHYQNQSKLVQDLIAFANEFHTADYAN